MQEYVCGFLFSPDRARVLLIRKRRPAWQAGKLNGIGGKVEPGETPIDAMRREFWEEAGIHHAEWEPVLTLAGPDWHATFYRAFGDVDAAQAMTDEALEIHPVRLLQADIIPNLAWIVPLSLDEDVVGKAYAVDVRPAEVG